MLLPLDLSGVGNPKNYTVEYFITGHIMNLNSFSMLKKYYSTLQIVYPDQR